MRFRTLSLLSLGTLFTVAIAAPGQQAKPAAPGSVGALQGAPDAPATPAADEGDLGDLLGDPYENRAAGIWLRPPAGCETIRKLGGEEVVEFINRERRWAMKVHLASTKNPVGLTTTTDLSGREQMGLLDYTLERLTRAMSGAKVLRRDVVNIADGIPSEDPRQRVPNVGMIALRYTTGLERILAQQAIIQANEQMYYMISFTSPGRPEPVTTGDAPPAPKAAATALAAPALQPGETREIAVEEDTGEADPGEQLAVEAFRQVLDSIKLLDRSKLKQEQDERLFKTRAMLVNLTPEKLTKSIVPQQWFRVVKKGRDVGYVYWVEELADGIPQPDEIKKAGGVGNVAAGETGILVGTRSRMITEPTEKDPVAKQVDAESWMFVSLDRQHEDWSSLVVTTDPKTGGKDHLAEFGTSDRKKGFQINKEGLELGIRGEEGDPNQPPVNPIEEYLLNVTHVAKSGTPEPVARALPQWYMPQALGKMLPRLLTKTPKQYMFAAYVGEQREVMHRYVDVELPQRVTLAGRVMRAIPIRDRITLGGSVTTHYMSETWQYLGSENADSHIAILPTDEKTLRELWKDANFSRPGDVAQPGIVPPQRKPKAEPQVGTPAPRRPGAAPQQSDSRAPTQIPGIGRDRQ